MNPYQPTPEQEQAWAEHKEACYQRWRTNLMRRCVTYVESGPRWDRGKRLSYVRKRMGRKADAFMTELAEILSRRRRET